MLSSKKLKWRRVINELEYLYDEYDIVSELTKQTGSTELAVAEPEVEDEYGEFEDDDSFKELHTEFNKLFKKLALILHPDRIENHTSDDEYKRKLAADFSKARQSLEKKRYFELIKLAKKYNVFIPESYTLQVRWFKKDKENIMTEINKTKKTYNYKFSECENDSERDALIKSFISQVFRIKK